MIGQYTLREHRSNNYEMGVPWPGLGDAESTRVLESFEKSTPSTAVPTKKRKKRAVAGDEKGPEAAAISSSSCYSYSYSLLVFFAMYAFKSPAVF